VRKQYHFRPSERGLYAWDVDRLVALTADLPIEQLPLSSIREVDSSYWFDHGADATVRALVEHMHLANEADLAYAIIVDPEGRVMDGMHRVAKALLAGHQSIAARRLHVLPEPDYTDVQPDELPYE
jgi:hypothetical protein